MRVPTGAPTPEKNSNTQIKVMPTPTSNDFSVLEFRIHAKALTKVCYTIGQRVVLANA